MRHHLLFEHAPPPTEEEEAELEAARNAAIKARRALHALDVPPDHAAYKAAQAEVSRTAAIMENFPTPIFCFERGEMGLHAIASQLLGLCHDYGPHPDWPEEPEGLTDGEIAIAMNPDQFPTRTPLPEAVAFTQARDQVRSWHGDGQPQGIARHKLDDSSDDYWLVTPGEITAGLAAYRAQPESDITRVLDACRLSRQAWARWIDYLDRARDHGGARVR
ncbi:hypothetical protein [Streptomyces sp. NRRL S-350]|uniref:hypothetical protein n=1 Tax=Streptomyces sp. NRRL S-350 TaxID=1463902 RepID=UPI0004BF24CA|nr:hypothetical protein [Streptomyces sp. NRRL S-350]